MFKRTYFFVVFLLSLFYYDYFSNKDFLKKIMFCDKERLENRNTFECQKRKPQETHKSARLDLPA